MRRASVSGQLSIYAEGSISIDIEINLPRLRTDGSYFYMLVSCFFDIYWLFSLIASTSIPKFVSQAITFTSCPSIPYQAAASLI